MVKEERVEVKKTPTFVVGQVATETKPMVVDTRTEETYSVETALAKIMNDLEELKQLL